MANFSHKMTLETCHHKRFDVLKTNWICRLKIAEKNKIDKIIFQKRYFFTIIIRALLRKYCFFNNFFIHSRWKLQGRLWSSIYKAQLSHLQVNFYLCLCGFNTRDEIENLLFIFNRTESHACEASSLLFVWTLHRQQNFPIHSSKKKVKKGKSECLHIAFDFNAICRTSNG